MSHTTRRWGSSGLVSLLGENARRKIVSATRETNLEWEEFEALAGIESRARCRCKPGKHPCTNCGICYGYDGGDSWEADSIADEQGDAGSPEELGDITLGELLATSGVRLNFGEPPAIPASASCPCGLGPRGCHHRI